MLKNKVAIIAGGTSGISYEIVKLFSENNANVILFGSKKTLIQVNILKLPKMI